MERNRHTMISILITGFNRPDLLEKSIASVLNQGVQCEIFVHLDGPRNYDDSRLTKKCLELISNLKHPNLSLLRYENHDQNLGCKVAMWCALDWFFSQRSKGLILEDDIVLLGGALSATELLLDRFETNMEIGQISLSNQISKNSKSEISYYLSNYPFIWGWATWRDRWETNIRDLSVLLRTFPETFNAISISNQIGKRAFDYWMKRFESANLKNIDTWDFQWHFTNWVYGRKTIHFDKVFAVNVGFDFRATHTKTALKLDLINLKKLTEVQHQNLQIKPKKLSCISIIDRKISSRVFGIPHWFFHPFKFAKIFLERFSRI